ncbi:hypothetical protein BD560DRAFT_404785 [Blakeslea trispora]|nr:hypothetical protein BD560DRAFT_404785 [Blakeslea trispora]
MSFILTVPEAAATPDTIQFKIVAESESQEEANILPTCFRTFQQISWVHGKLKKAFESTVLPALPEPPMASHIDDQDYIERKRLQIERLFSKLSQRKELLEHPDLLHFLSSDMSPTQVGPVHTGVLSFLKFNRVMKPNSDRVLKSSEIIEGNDQETFHKHQAYILLQESYYGFIAESLNQLIQAREGLGEVMAHMGDLIIETTQSKYRLGLGLKPDLRESQKALDRKMQMLGLLMDELGFVFMRQGIEENMKFGDVMTEYKNSLDPLKTIFNTRTSKLMNYADQHKYHHKRKERAEKLTTRLGTHHPEAKEAMAEEAEALEQLEKSKQNFDSYQQKAKEEIKFFEDQKCKDLKKAIKDYVNLSLRYEKTKLLNLERTLGDMQQPMIRTIFPGYQLSPSTSVTKDDQQSTSSSLLAGSTDHRRKRRQQQKQHLHQNFKEMNKPLQSSASLPTRQHKQSEEDDLSDTHTNTIPTTNITPISTKEDNRVSLSASYDERFSIKNWLADS